VLLVAGVYDLWIPESTGRGILLDENLYLTNQCSTELGKLLSREFQAAIGTIERSHLLKGNAAAYWKNVPNQADPQPILKRWLQLLDAFFMALWTVRDNAVNCELGFVEHDVPGHGLAHSSNFKAALFVTARGKRERVTFSLEEVRLAREYFEKFFLSASFGIPLEQGGQFQQSHIQAASRAAVASAKGVHRIQRLMYFLTAARCSPDLGVKISLYMTCLEIMFSDKNVTEVSHRMSERVAFFLFRDPSERLEKYGRLKKAYDVRSKVVHGSVVSEGTQKEMPDVASDIDGLLRELVLRLMQDAAARAVFDLDDKAFEAYFARLTLGAVSPG